MLRTLHEEDLFFNPKNSNYTIFLHTTDMRTEYDVFVTQCLVIAVAHREYVHSVGLMYA